MERGSISPGGRADTIQTLKMQCATRPRQAMWGFMNVICAEQKNASRYHVHKALRALEEVGLMRIELGPRVGMMTAMCFWQSRAYLALARVAAAEDEAWRELA
jgi:hypothetical protein